ncbi:Protein of unknown function [Gryllus bimaculatus]|nr:Protein of unknown function [Gryllus bimaculatus]
MTQNVSQSFRSVSSGAGGMAGDCDDPLLSELRPIWFLLRVLGCAPLAWGGRGPRFRWVSWRVAYSVALWWLLGAAGAWVAGGSLLQGIHGTFDEKLFAAIAPPPAPQALGLAAGRGPSRGRHGAGGGREQPGARHDGRARGVLLRVRGDAGAPPRGALVARVLGDGANGPCSRRSPCGGRAKPVPFVGALSPNQRAANGMDPPRATAVEQEASAGSRASRDSLGRAGGRRGEEVAAWVARTLSRFMEPAPQALPAPTRAQEQQPASHGPARARTLFLSLSSSRIC